MAKTEAATEKPMDAIQGPNVITSSAQRVTDATAERQYVAQQIAERNKNPLNVATRPGGYFLSSGGIPQDCEGRTIPRDEWRPEDVERIEGANQRVPEAGSPAPVDPRGADRVDGSGSQHRKPQPPQG